VVIRIANSIFEIIEKKKKGQYDHELNFRFGISIVIWCYFLRSPPIMMTINVMLKMMIYFFWHIGKILSNDERKKRKHIFPCPQSIERASMNIYLIAILLCLSRARLCLYRWICWASFLLYRNTHVWKIKYIYEMEKRHCSTVTDFILLFFYSIEWW